MNAYATVAQIQFISDGERRCWARRCGGNRVCRLITNMRTTQGHATFGYNVQTIITYSNMVITCLHRCLWTHLFNARRTYLLWSLNTQKNVFCELLEFPQYSGKSKPHCQATPIEFGSPHEAICARSVDKCLLILHSY
jgi:hypothetical protein